MSAAGDEVLASARSAADPPGADRAPDRGPPPGGRHGPARVAEQLQRHGDPRVGDDERSSPAAGCWRRSTCSTGPRCCAPPGRGRWTRCETIMTVFDQTLFRAVPAAVPGDGGRAHRRCQRDGAHPGARVRALRVLGGRGPRRQPVRDRRGDPPGGGHACRARPALAAGVGRAGRAHDDRSTPATRPPRASW